MRPGTASSRPGIYQTHPGWGFGRLRMGRAAQRWSREALSCSSDGGQPRRPPEAAPLVRRSCPRHGCLWRDASASRRTDQTATVQAGQEKSLGGAIARTRVVTLVLGLITWALCASESPHGGSPLESWSHESPVVLEVPAGDAHAGRRGVRHPQPPLRRVHAGAARRTIYSREIRARSSRIRTLYRHGRLPRECSHASPAFSVRPAV